MFEAPKQKNFPEIEHEILEIWEKEKTFEKQLEKNQDKKKFVFFDGPPFANGLPHYGHILANSLKDAVTRYFSMKGRYVPRTNGWDCHGLPVEYEIEKELNLSGKKDIEKLGIENFNLKCRESVFRYTNEWETLLKRIARWVDFNQSYATLENRYMESIWYVFKQIWDKGLIYEGHKSMHICPRCETPLSNFEVSQGYKDVTDFSVTAKFAIKNWPEKLDAPLYFLAWTTTPWTLPGNSGLAVGKKIKYALLKNENSYYLLGKDLVSKIFGDKKVEIIKELKGSELEGLEYEPLFPYYLNKKWEGGEKPYRVICGDFVSTEDGTGIVHIAPAFGEDDLNAGKANKLPIIQHVNFDGTFKAEVSDFAGKFVKNQDQNIAKYLSEKNLLFSSENFRHSYPHCWRCDTPLLNYSTKSWFIKVTELTKKLLKNNKKIHWQPEHIKEGRFGKWLSGARDWAISRNRFWGCAMPIFICESCGEKKCVGSIKELLSATTNTVTNVYVMRHGVTNHNLEDRWQGQSDVSLSEEGIKQAYSAKEKLKNIKFDVIFSSDLSRASKTAEIIAEGRNIEIIGVKEFREKDNGTLTGLTTAEIKEKFPQEWEKRIQNKHIYKYPEGESGEEVEKRAVEAFKKVVRENRGKTILIVAHQGILRVLKKYYDDLSLDQMYRFFPENCEILHFPVIHKEKFPDHLKGDIHKPYIDDVKIRCSCGKEASRIPEVLDCWFESGAMPYAQLHYPFENKDEFEKNFPADFIAEGLDQTRGWFYTLHVLSTILFGSHCFDNVIVNGILLAKDGEKLSKRKKNYPDPNMLFESRGVDAVRFFLYNSVAPLAQDVRFSEGHIDEIVKKLLIPLYNSFSFFVTYANIDSWHPSDKKRFKKPATKLDLWIISELNTLIKTVTKKMDEYNLTEATRPLLDFLDNLSNWYIRRSRRRFWKSENDADKDAAYSTLYTVLTKYLTLLAPFTPFISDYLFRKISEKSVHLEDWPKAKISEIDQKLNEEMALIARVVKLGHSIRAKSKIKVRQPLSLIKVALAQNFDRKLLEKEKAMILEELNVKNLSFVDDLGTAVKMVVKPNFPKLGPKYGKDVQKISLLAKNGEFEILDEKKIKLGEYILEGEEFELAYVGEEGFGIESEGGIVVMLDTSITEELKNEGIARDLVRIIQDLRKEADYKVDDRIFVLLKLSPKFKSMLTAFSSYIKNETLAEEIQLSKDMEWDKEREAEIEGEKIVVAVKKA